LTASVKHFSPDQILFTLLLGGAIAAALFCRQCTLY